MIVTGVTTRVMTSTSVTDVVGHLAEADDRVSTSTMIMRLSVVATVRVAMNTTAMTADMAITTVRNKP